VRSLARGFKSRRNFISQVRAGLPAGKVRRGGATPRTRTRGETSREIYQLREDVIARADSAAIEVAMRVRRQYILIEQIPGGSRDPHGNAGGYLFAFRQLAGH
jgi:hypothetical protein